jgi:hypothetical protein
MKIGACDGLEWGDSGIDWRRELVRGYGHHRARSGWWQIRKSVRFFDTSTVVYAHILVSCSNDCICQKAKRRHRLPADSCTTATER